MHHSPASPARRKKTPNCWNRPRYSTWTAITAQPNRSPRLKRVVVGRVDVDAPHFARVVFLQGFQRQQVVAVDEHILRFGITRRIGELRSLQQNPRLQMQRFVLSHPRQFQFVCQQVHLIAVLSVLFYCTKFHVLCTVFTVFPPPVCFTRPRFHTGFAPLGAAPARCKMRLLWCN